MEAQRGEQFIREQVQLMSKAQLLRGFAQPIVVVRMRMARKWRTVALFGTMHAGLRMRSRRTLRSGQSLCELLHADPRAVRCHGRRRGQRMSSEAQSLRGFAQPIVVLRMGMARK